MPMFDTPQPTNNPTPMGSGSFGVPPNLPPTPPPPTPPAGPTGAAPVVSQPKAFTMPEKFRSGGNQPSGGGNRKLIIILVIVLAVAGLGIGGLYVFQNVFKGNSNENTNAVVVVNQNTNQTANENANLANANDNLNQNDNINAVSNLNENTNIANTNTTTNSNTNVSTTPIASSADTDSDGLTDVEEVVYGTEVSKPDSDNDGFIDGKQLRADGQYNGEIYNGYNPTGTGRLEDSTSVKRQNNSANEYSILMPAAWTAVLDQSGGILITPSQSTTEFFQVRTYDNANSQAPKDWYKSISPEADTSTLKTTTVNGLEGIYSEDGSTVYLFKGNKVYGITYNTGSATQANYYTTFDVIVRNFKLVSST